jgi:predicted nucleic acid-binding protein
MVLIDTSIWIRFLANRSPWAAGLDELLGTGDAAGHDLVYGELIIGDSGGRRKVLEAYQLIRQVPTVAHTEVVHFVREHKLYGRGIGWIDAHLLASCLISGALFWTADHHLTKLADEFRISHVPSLR